MFRNSTWNFLLFFNSNSYHLFVINHHVDNDEAHPTIPKTVAQLYEDDIIEAVMQQYTDLVTKNKLPSHLNQSQAMIWANRVVSEQAGMLRILFYIFFETKYKFSILPKLARLFQLNDFGCKQANYALLNDKARECVVSMNYLCSLILVESLQLEQLFAEST